jgi:endo-1,4-beta-xylanase
MFKIFLACFALMFASGLCAQNLPQGGIPLFSQPVLDVLSIGNNTKGTAEKVSFKGEANREGLKLTTLVNAVNPWDVQVDAVVPVAVKKGDVIYAEFWMKAVESHAESGEANSEFGFERLGEPWTKSIGYTLSAGSQWRKFSIPFTIVEDLDAGKSHIYFRMGYHPQAFVIADLKLITYAGTSVKLADLPQTKMTYAGEEADAPWRKDAEARIEKIRKGDLVVTVLDPARSPQPNVKVSVRMKRHDFGFGTAVVAKTLATSGGTNDKYQQEVARLFNKVVFENDMKWGPWETGASNTDSNWRREYVEGAMKWLSDRHFDVRGHNMVWGTWRYLPADVKELENDPKALEAKIESRIKDVGGAMKGQLAEWDVVNEPVPEHQLTDILGKQAMITWYKLAHQVDPKPLLFVNDYPDPDSGHLDAYDEIIQYLIQNGAPLGGIGFQGHVGSAPWSIPALLRALDKLGAHGLPVEITEYDTEIKDPQLDAQFLKDFMTAVFSHPSTNGFLMWGFWDGAHWHSEAPIFNQDWTEKLSGQAYEQLVLHDWWTNADGLTNARGTYQVRGFTGDYEVTVTQGNQTVTVPAHLTNAGTQLKIELK